MLYWVWNQDWTAQLSFKSPARLAGTGHAMTSKETGKSHTPPDGTERDFATLADQWADENWYLPPSGDQSWRDLEARRLFGGDGEEREAARAGQRRRRRRRARNELELALRTGDRHRPQDTRELFRSLNLDALRMVARALTRELDEPATATFPSLAMTRAPPFGQLAA